VRASVASVASRAIAASTSCTYAPRHVTMADCQRERALASQALANGSVRGAASRREAWRCVAVRGGAWRCGAVRGGAWRCVAVRGGAWRCVAVRGGAGRCVAVRCGAVRVRRAAPKRCARASYAPTSMDRGWRPPRCRAQALCAVVRGGARRGACAIVGGAAQRRCTCMAQTSSIKYFWPPYDEMTSFSWGESSRRVRMTSHSSSLRGGPPARV
jgi:hypothetical protein